GIVGAFSSAPAEAVLAEADLVVGFGAELGHYTTEGGLLFPDAEALRIDMEHAPIAVGGFPGAFLQGDARAVAAALAAGLAGPAREGFRSEETRRALAVPPPPHDVVTDGVDPRSLMRELGPQLPARARVFCGVGHYWSFAGQYLALRPDVEMRFVYGF